MDIIYTPSYEDPMYKKNFFDEYELECKYQEDFGAVLEPWKNQFPEPIGKMRGKKSDGKTCLFNYWDKKVIYKWLEGRFEEIKDQLSQSIRYHITVFHKTSFGDPL